MANKQSTDYKNEKTFELLLWHLKRFDKMRVTISNRAAIVLSANALLLTGTAFLIDKTLSIKINISEQLIIISCICLTFILLGFSTYYSMNTLISIKSSRELFGDLPKMLFFSPRDTVDEYKNNYEEFKKRILNLTIEENILYATTTLWNGINHNWLRYQFLRKATKYIILSMIAFLFTIIVLFLNIIL